MKKFIIERQKPRIFIGSSSEGYSVAKYIHDKLNSAFECYLWKGDLFKYNSSAFETLSNEAGLFDFGILIATKDDLLKSRGKEYNAARDNVIFEFGLFLGKLGTSRVFLMQEAGCKLPSDLFGITVPVFNRTKQLSESKTLNDVIKTISNRIVEKAKIGELGFLPSTALAIGYFYNFVSLVCDYFSSGKKINGRTYKRIEVNIVIPKLLDSDIKKQAQAYYRNNKLKEVQIRTQRRSFPVFIMYAKEDDSVLRIYDIPTTLLSSAQAIKLFLKKGHVGKTDEQMFLENRELRNFKIVLDALITEDSFCKGKVKILVETKKTFPQGIDLAEKTIKKQ